LQGVAVTQQPAADLLDEYRGRRLAFAIKHARGRAAATGRLAVSEEDCRDILFATMGSALWHRLVAERG
jgi:hypothetical protein